jgi:DNA polymerase III subunit epsilon
MSVLEGPLVFVDVETTGLSYSRSRVIEVAAIRVEGGRQVAKFSSLIDPQTELPMFITELTGITRQQLVSSPTFYQIADELHSLLDGALFVAHNVRFDYGFLKQEFKRLNKAFSPKMMCTVRLSKALYPDTRGHKLEDIINRCGITAVNRHRAFDDAKAMWQFIQHSQLHFPAPVVDQAIKQQVKSPSLPKNLDNQMVRDLPEEPGVYIFNDDKGSPLYIGKSVNIRKRVLSHFSGDHEYESEFKISQQVAAVDTITTGGELSALLLESKMVKERQPVYNRQLRRRQKLTLARQQINDNGYITVSTADTDRIDPGAIKNILGVYTTKGKAKQFLDQIIKDYGLCPKLMGLEKGAGSCFAYQLKKCAGACSGKEDMVTYNKRLLAVFEGRRLQEWPYQSPILIEEKSDSQKTSAVVVDQWCVVATISVEPDCEPVVTMQDRLFDIDTYKILSGYLRNHPSKLKLKPVSREWLNSLADTENSIMTPINLSAVTA